jgi:hypothetical protein
MGQLSDAIREHLELKRRHGATDDEISRQEAEALGPVRREPEPAEPLAAEDEFAPASFDDPTALMGGSTVRQESVPAEEPADLAPADHDAVLDSDLEGAPDYDFDHPAHADRYDFPLESEESAAPADVFPEPDPAVPDERLSAEEPPPEGSRPIVDDEPVVHDEPLDEHGPSLEGPVGGHGSELDIPSTGREPLEERGLSEEPRDIEASPLGEDDSLIEEPPFLDTSLEDDFPLAEEPPLAAEPPLSGEEPVAAEGALETDISLSEEGFRGAETPPEERFLGAEPPDEEGFLGAEPPLDEAGAPESEPPLAGPSSPAEPEPVAGPSSLAAPLADEGRSESEPPSLLEEEPPLSDEPPLTDEPLDEEGSLAAGEAALIEDEEPLFDEEMDEPALFAEPPPADQESESDLEEDIAASLAYEDAAADFAPPPPPRRGKGEEPRDPDGLDFDA